MPAPPPIRAVICCVEYDDLLAMTLPLNSKHFSEVVVVTSYADDRTRDVVRSVPGARFFCTDAFYADGAKFNKWRAIEVALDDMGRTGGLGHLDADILSPPTRSLPPLDPNKLYAPLRRILPDIAQWYPGLDWSRLILRRDKHNEYPGYFHLFNAAAPVLHKTPWYGTEWTHAGGGDKEFQNRFGDARKVRLDFDVLHLGPVDANWFGRVTERLDGEAIPEVAARHADMEAFLAGKGWSRPKSRAVVAERLASATPVSEIKQPAAPRRPAQVSQPPKTQQQRVRSRYIATPTKKRPLP